MRVKQRPNKWQTESLSGGIGRITFCKSTWVLLSSDWHWDSLHCDRDRLAADLALAKRLNASVVCLGDLFDCMGGKYDPRSNGKNDIRPELQSGNYFDEIVTQAAEWLHPYREQIAFISPGNHETAVRKRQETCLMTRLAERLRQAGSPVVCGGYAGWLLFRGVHSSGNASVMHRIWYHHGYGGGGPVTRGVIDFSRYLVDVDADTIVAGHIHQRTLIEASRQRITSNGIPQINPIYLVRSAAYKQESMTDGWAVEKGMSSRPLGGWWLRLRINKHKSAMTASFHDRPTTEDEDAAA